MVLPVEKLNYSITEIYKNLSSLNVQSIIDMGLKNEIKLQDYVDGEQFLAEVHDDGQVYLSLSFAQSLWNICYAFLHYADYMMVEKEFTANGVSFFNVYNEIKSSHCKDERALYLKELYESIKWEEMMAMFNKFINITYKEEDIELLEILDLKTLFCTKVSGLYRYALAFVLLHELFHFSNGHFSDSCSLSDTEQEYDADSSAFKVFLKDLSGEELKSSIYGSVSTLLSFFFLNINFETPEVHPREDLRLFAIYHLIDEEECKMKVNTLIIQVLRKWGELTTNKEISAFFKSNPTSIEKIEEYLKSI